MKPQGFSPPAGAKNIRKASVKIRKKTSRRQTYQVENFLLFVRLSLIICSKNRMSVYPSKFLAFFIISFFKTNLLYTDVSILAVFLSSLYTFVTRQNVHTDGWPNKFKGSLNPGREWTLDSKLYWSLKIYKKKFSNHLLFFRNINWFIQPSSVQTFPPIILVYRKA